MIGDREAIEALRKAGVIRDESAEAKRRVFEHCLADQLPWVMLLPRGSGGPDRLSILANVSLEEAENIVLALSKVIRKQRGEVEKAPSKERRQRHTDDPKHGDEA